MWENSTIQVSLRGHRDQPYLDTTWPVLPQQSAYPLKVHRARSLRQVTSCLEKSQKKREEREAAMFCKTMATAENGNHGWLWCWLLNWTRVRVSAFHSIDYVAFSFCTIQLLEDDNQQILQMSLQFKTLSMDSLQHGCTQHICSLWCASLEAQSRYFFSVWFDCL